MHMSASRALSLGSGAWLSLLVAVATVVWSDANRFLPPVREKYTDVIGFGGSDFLPTFNAAAAWLDGQNPYHSDPNKYVDPYANSRGAAQHVTYLYAPTHILVYVPLVILSGRNLLTAVRLQFILSMLLIVALSFAVTRLLALIVPLSHELELALIPSVAIILGLNPGDQLGLERGQSDLLTAAACWWAVLAFCRGHVGTAAFLAVAGSLLKGYGLPLAVGLLALSLTRSRWLPALLGALLALALLLLPVVRYLPDAARAYPIRAHMFWPAWLNQSLFHLGYHLKRQAAANLRWVFIGVAGVTSALAWLRARASLRDGDPSGSALGLCLFASAATIFILAFSLNSIAYSSVLVLPGAIIIALTQQRHAHFAAPALAALIELVFAALMFGFCAFNLPRWLGRQPLPSDLPLHALAQLLLLGWIVVACLRGQVWSGSERNAALRR
jgi:hypothetical protein